MTRTKLLRAIRIFLSILVIVLIGAYATWRSLPYARGPEITVFEPVDGATISSSTVAVLGRAERINSLTLNGHPLSVDSEDAFRETVALFPGMNIITLSASDQFGRSIRAEVRIWSAGGSGI